MKIKKRNRKQIEILLESLRNSVYFRRQLAQQFEDGTFNFDLLKNDPAYDAALRIVRMYIKNDKLLGWWLDDNMYDGCSFDEGYSDDDGNYVCIEDAADLIDYYEYCKRTK